MLNITPPDGSYDSSYPNNSHAKQPQGQPKTALQPNVAHTAFMLKALEPSFPNAEFTFQTFDDSKERKDPKLAKIFNGKFGQFSQDLVNLNQTGAGLFVTVNQTDGKGRKAENIIGVRAVFVDFDTADQNRLNKLLSLSEIPIPSFIVESSPAKHHAYWICDGLPLDQFTKFQKKLIQYFTNKGDTPDSLKDLPRVMRLCGFWHNKSEPFQSKIVYPSDLKSDIKRYSLDEMRDFYATLPKVEQSTPASVSPTPPPKTFNKPNNGSMPMLTAELVRQQAQGKWHMILHSLGYHVSSNPKEHTPCPACGGKDRFRFDDIEGKGTWLCSQGGKGQVSGDGLSFLIDHVGMRPNQAQQAVASVLGITAPTMQQAQPQAPYAIQNLPNGGQPKQANEWGELGLLRDDIKQTAQPFPINCFPEIIKNAILAIQEHSQASIQICTMSVLGALTAIAQSKVSARFIFSTKPVSLFLLTEGETGAGKTQSFEYSYKSIRDYIIKEEITYERELESYKQQLETFTDPKERKEFIKENPLPVHPDFVVEDSTIEALFNKFVVEGHKDLVWQSDDAGIILGGHSFKSDKQANVIGSLTKVWSSQIATRNRLDGQDKKKARWCNLTLDLMGQNVVLEPLLADPLYAGQGFLSRFLFMKSEDNRGNRVFNDIDRLMNESPYLDRRLLEYWQLCDELLDPLPTRFPTTDDPTKDHRFIIEYDSMEVMKFHADYQQRCEELQQKGKLYEYSKDIANRLAENACKLATIFAFFDNRLTTTIPDYERATAIVDYCMNERMRYFKEIQTTAKTEPELMIEWFTKRCKDNNINQMGKREFMQKVTPKTLRNKEVFWDNIDFLVEQNYIKFIKDKTIEINPILLN